MSSDSDSLSVPTSSSTAPAKNVPWTYDENDTLLNRVKDYIDSRGRPKWAAVAEGLPGRTAQEARCRYRRISDAETRRKKGESFRNKCLTCGQLRRGHVCPGVTIASRNAKLAAARAPEAQRAALKRATEAVLPPQGREVQMKVASVQEPVAQKLEVNVEKLEMSVVDLDGFKTADETEAFPALPTSMQRSPTLMSADNSLNEWLTKFDSAGPSSLDANINTLKRLPSMTAYIESFFNTSDEGLYCGGGLAPQDSLLGHGKVIEVM
mmetsp:Transcript_17859/g.36297  ORF Transcript_17859/g.36297 Transcript_17859/m.36297 type:complete len:266 (+) Transcript_17859:129-926(+)